MSSKKGNHPEIGSLVRAKDEMWNCFENYDYVNGLKKMYRILMDIRGNDVPKDFRERVRRELATLTSYHYHSGKLRRITDMSRVYWEWANQTVQILWDKNYLIDEYYGMSYPANYSAEGVYRSPLLPRSPSSPD